MLFYEGIDEGSPAKVIMTFALPIIFGNLLQQLYIWQMVKLSALM